MKLAIGFLVLIFSYSAYARCPVAPINQPNEDAKKLRVNQLSEFMVCLPSDPANDRSPCNTFASQGLNKIWGYNDFGTDEKTFLTANQIWDKVNSAGGKWLTLGALSDVDNNLCAQSLANSGRAVLAVMKGTDGGHGHIALVIPGEPQISTTWGILAANSASFFLNKPTKAYISQPLSFAFSKTDASEARFFYRDR